LNENARLQFQQRVDAIEEAYEYCLAYAAQGHEAEIEEAEGIRHFLRQMDQALAGLGASVTACIADENGAAPPEWQNYLELLDQDSGKALAAVRLVVMRASISSQLIDNLNASIHVRTLLTDLFLVDEAMRQIH
jgi:hypothetical protein